MYDYFYKLMLLSLHKLQKCYSATKYPLKFLPFLPIPLSKLHVFLFLLFMLVVIVVMVHAASQTLALPLTQAVYRQHSLHASTDYRNESLGMDELPFFCRIPWLPFSNLRIKVPG